MIKRGRISETLSLALTIDLTSPLGKWWSGDMANDDEKPPLLCSNGPCAHFERFHNVDDRSLRFSNFHSVASLRVAEPAQRRTF